MASVDVTVAGRSYQLACEDGQERRLRTLAEGLDRQAKALMAQTGPVGESRLMLMLALTLADRLEEAQAARAAPPPAEVAALTAAVARIEALAAGRGA